MPTRTTTTIPDATTPSAMKCPVLDDSEGPEYRKTIILLQVLLLITLYLNLVASNYK